MKCCDCVGSAMYHTIHPKDGNNGELVILANIGNVSLILEACFTHQNQPIRRRQQPVWGNCVVCTAQLGVIIMHMIHFCCYGYYCVKALKNPKYPSVESE